MGDLIMNDLALADLDIGWITSVRLDYPSEVLEICRLSRHRLIERLAYKRAQARGFAPGRELEDWLFAEEEVKRYVDWE